MPQARESMLNRLYCLNILRKKLYHYYSLKSFAMKIRNLSLPIAIAAVCIIFTSCKKDDKTEVTVSYYPQDEFAMMSEYLDLPEEPLEYILDFPEYYNTDRTTYDKDLATLGRVLFYDKNLSEDRKISCASCHKQELAFSDNVALSDGINQKKTARNSIALGSVFSFSEYYGAESFGRIPFFWDNRASSVAEQATGSFGNEQEMGLEMHEVVARVNEQPYYAPLFKAAFGRGDEMINEENVLEAVSEFVNSMGSFDSKFDQGLSMVRVEQGGGNLNSLASNYDFPNFDEVENLGKAIYQANCASCHSAILSAPPKTRSNNGLDLEYDDKGIGAYTNASQDMGMFKVPTLRNISLTGPYMHDGRFATLEEVLDHYSNGIQNHQNLDYDLKSGGQPKQFNFTEEERAALIAFFATGTDVSYTTVDKYSDPFKQ